MSEAKPTPFRAEDFPELLECNPENALYAVRLANAKLAEMLSGPVFRNDRTSVDPGIWFPGQNHDDNQVSWLFDPRPIEKEKADTAEQILKDLIGAADSLRQENPMLSVGYYVDRAKRLLDIAKEYYEGERTVKVACDHIPIIRDWVRDGSSEFITNCRKCGAKLKAKWEVADV